MWERETKDDFRDLVPCACLKRWPCHLLRWGEGRGQQTTRGDAAGWRNLAGDWLLVLDFPEPLSIHLCAHSLTTHVPHHRLLAPPCKISHVLGPHGRWSPHGSLSQVCIPLWVSWDGGGRSLQSRLRFAAAECSRESQTMLISLHTGMQFQAIWSWTDFGLGFCFRPELRQKHLNFLISSYTARDSRHGWKLSQLWVAFYSGVFFPIWVKNQAGFSASSAVDFGI